MSDCTSTEQRDEKWLVAVQWLGVMPRLASKSLSSRAMALRLDGAGVLDAPQLADVHDLARAEHQHEHDDTSLRAVGVPRRA